MNKTMVTLLCTTLLGGCTMVPDYLRPDLPVSDTWQQEESLPALSSEQQQAVSDIVWQKFFLSPGMQQVVETALNNNRDLRVAALNVEAARALYRVERSDLFPNVSAGASSTRQKVTEAQSTSNPLFGTPQEYITSTYTANLASTAFELDLFGRLRSQNEAALETYFATQSARDAAQISLIAEVANAYLQWLADRKILALTQETLDAQQKSYDLIAKSYEKGVASKLDQAQVRQAVETARTNLALYTRRVMQDQNALVLLMGVKALPTSLQNERLDDVAVLKNLPVGLASDVLLMRPDVQQAEHQLLSDNANIGAARAAFFPTISLTGTFGYASSDLGDLFSSGASGAWSFAPQITLPIFQGGRNIANLDYAKLIKEASVARYEQTIQTAFKEVADELAARSTLDDELNAQHGLVEATQDAYDLSYARYKQGIDNFLNVLDAQRSLFSAQQQEIEIQKQQLANLVNLYKVLGGGAQMQSLDDESAEALSSENGT
ncbi:MAG: multidrug transporter [Rickettsiales bacterium]|nr:multidrug transporter [Rickettsiales bacterium]